MAEKNDKKLKIQLIKSPFGFHKDQIGTVRALGLKRISQIREVSDTSVIRGMIFKIKHLIKVL